MSRTSTVCCQLPPSSPLKGRTVAGGAPGDRREKNVVSLSGKNDPKGEEATFAQEAERKPGRSARSSRSKSRSRDESTLKGLVKGVGEGRSLAGKRERLPLPLDGVRAERSVKVLMLAIKTQLLRAKLELMQLRLDVIPDDLRRKIHFLGIVRAATMFPCARVETSCSPRLGLAAGVTTRRETLDGGREKKYFVFSFCVASLRSAPVKRTAQLSTPGRILPTLCNLFHAGFASKVLRENSTGISDLWIEFVKYHTSQSFFNEVVDIFGYDLERYRRDVPLKMGKSFQTLRTGVRNLKSRNKPDIVLDAQIAMNTPVRRQGTTVRGEHVDHLNEVYAGLLYFRSPDDTSSGGSLEILECVRGKTCKKIPKTDHRSRSWQVQFNPKDMRTVAEVPYEKNTLVMFVNGRTSYHRVSKRSQTMFPRRLVNLIGEYH
ncbi:unnamed protein product [Bathycoccus prasinos]